MTRPPSPPNATIIVPILDQRPFFLKRALFSLSQTVPVEVIIVSALATPSGTRELIRAHCRKESAIWIEQSRPGFAAAINEGIQRATGSRIGLLLSDDWLDADAVEVCLQFDADIVSSGLLIHDGRGAACAKRVPSAARLRTMKHPWEIANCLTHFLLLRRSLVIQVGMLDEAIGDSPGVDDFDLLWTLIEHSATFAVTETPVYHYTDHAGLRLTLRNKEEMTRTFDRILDKHKVAPDLRRRLHRDHAEWFGIRILPKMRELISSL
jgi:GT2 family glycosyltransferase